MHISTDFMIMISAAGAAVTRRTGINTDIMIMISAAGAAVTRRMHCS
jgi:hypothetical protein